MWCWEEKKLQQNAKKTHKHFLSPVISIEYEREKLTACFWFVIDCVSLMNFTFTKTKWNFVFSWSKQFWFQMFIEGEQMIWGVRSEREKKTNEITFVTSIDGTQWFDRNNLSICCFMLFFPFNLWHIKAVFLCICEKKIYKSVNAIGLNVHHIKWTLKRAFNNFKQYKICFFFVVVSTVDLFVFAC